MTLITSHVPLTFLLFSLVVVRVYSQGCSTSDGGRGQCVSIRNCPAVLQILQSAQSGSDPGAASKLREILKSRCTFGGGTFSVCCATSSEVNSGPQTPIPLTPPPGPAPQTPSSLLPQRCGLRGLVDLVVSGEDAPLSAWPWMALLEAIGENGRPALICGGVLISERYVLTAAHCVHPRTGFTLQNIRLGEHTLSTDPDCRGGVCADPLQKIGVEQTVIHESYGDPFGCRNCNDIALLRLSRTVRFQSAYVQPVCLPLNLQNDLGFSQDQFDQREGWVAGWGTTDPRETRPADVLQQVLLPINSSLCSLDLRVFPDPKMALCAGGQRKDTCRGDSGGPLVMSSAGERRYYVVGIVSRGPVVCAAANTGGLYTSISHYVPWILRNLRP
ncbi:phenoloxidase-activating factor 3-like [Macrobrachium rosenbergii]|uniref:phenoloxidase-activating factor 3-like n=1 Tax=Macrobrachium rosenbergii TaxID=79674 RepID=UPI0034D414A7